MYYILTMWFYLEENLFKIILRFIRKIICNFTNYREYRKTEKFSISKKCIVLYIKFSFNLSKWHFATYFIWKVVLEITP